MMPRIDTFSENSITEKSIIEVSEIQNSNIKKSQTEISNIPKRNSKFLAPFIATSVLFFVWTISRQDTSIIRPQSENSEENLEKCLKKYDNRRLWTKNLKNFQEPPCDAILTDLTEDSIDSAKNWTPSNPYDDQSLLELIKNCKNLKKLSRFPNRPNSKKESNYPLAYVITAQENSDQTLKFFRNIFWPQNFYCFALSPDSEAFYKKFLHSLVECFPENVFIRGGLEKQNFSESKNRYRFLENIFDCFGLLKNRTWEYLQIVSSDDFPLKTNLQLINILPLINESNDCSLDFSRGDEFCENQNPVNDNETAKSIPPFGIILFRGNLACTLSKNFVQFLVDNEKSYSFFRWLDGTSRPELYFWNTLVHNLQLNPPGGFPASCLWFYDVRSEKKLTISSISIWDHEITEDRSSCRNSVGFVEKEMRKLCTVDIREVAWYVQQPQLMARRFDISKEPASLYCFEKWHWRKVCENIVDVDENFYENLQISKYASTVEKDKYLC